MIRVFLDGICFVSISFFGYYVYHVGKLNSLQQYWAANRVLLLFQFLMHRWLPPPFILLIDYCLFFIHCNYINPCFSPINYYRKFSFNGHGFLWCSHPPISNTHQVISLRLTNTTSEALSTRLQDLFLCRGFLFVSSLSYCFHIYGYPHDQSLFSFMETIR